MFQLLVLGILTLLTLGAFVYAVMMQDSPVRGLWLCTVWASAASVDPAVTALEGHARGSSRHSIPWCHPGQVT